MAEQMYWEDVEVGSEIPPVSKIATTRMLVQWAGALVDFNPLHFDASFAASHGLERPIVHGQLKQAWLVHLITNWIGDGGSLKKIFCRFRTVDYPRQMKTIAEPEEGETWWCKGKVSDKYVKDGEHYVDCEIWVENGKGEQTTAGVATVILPSRAGR
jgi:hypothetical protein